MYKKILLPVDVFEMDLSDKAVRHAEFLASADEGEITLLNVLPNSSSSILRGFAADIRKFEAYMREESEKKMKTISRLFSIPAGRVPASRVYPLIFLVQTLSRFYVTLKYRFWLSDKTHHQSLAAENLFCRNSFYSSLNQSLFS